MALANKRLFIGSLPYRYSESELLKLFITCGKVIDVRIIRNHWGRSRGMGYVEFEKVEEAILAKEKLHKYQIKDMYIIVDFAKSDPAPSGEDKFKPEGKAQFRKKTNKDNKHIRQSVYDSRKFGSKMGKKFASRNKKSKK